MARPRYQPGSRHVIEVKRHRGRKPVATYLASRLCINDRRTLYLLEHGQVLVNGARVAASDFIDLEGHSTIEVLFPVNWPPYLEPTELPLDILHEEEAFVVLNKQPGIVVHPARGHLSGNTLQNGLIHRYLNVPHPDKTIAPVHRLDKDTTGVLVFARTREAYRDLTRQFSTPCPKKTYLAVCSGRADWQACTVDQPLGEDPDWPSRGRILPVSEGGREAVTELRCVESGPDWTLVEARPVTGRGHQIRLHLAYLGLPILADRDYNPAPVCPLISRQALHACELTIAHPLTGAPLTFRAPLPADLNALLNALRAGASADAAQE